MFSLRDLRFVLRCSRDLDELRTQRTISFFYVDYPQINEVGKSDHMERAEITKTTTKTKEKQQQQQPQRQEN